MAEIENKIGNEEMDINEIEMERQWAESFKKKLAEREKQKKEMKERRNQEIRKGFERFLRSNAKYLAIYRSGKYVLTNDVNVLYDDRNEHASDDEVLAFWIDKKEFEEEFEKSNKSIDEFLDYFINDLIKLYF